MCVYTVYILCVYIHYMLCCMLNCSVVSDSAPPWAVALQILLSMGILQARILE